MKKRIGLAVVLALSLSGEAQQQQAVLASTPPMGWNSWDSYGLTIDEAQFKANVDVMAERLKAAGYEYAVVDEGWYLQNPKKAKEEAFNYIVDMNGRFQPAPNRFPSGGGTGFRAGTAGFQPLAEYVHARGLKFGIHIIRGISQGAEARNTVIEGSSFHARDAADTTDTCPWNPDNFGVKDNAAGQAWYDSLMKQYASWGVDYIKVDCIAAHPYKGNEIRMIHRAIEKTGRPMVLSLSPGPAPLDKSAEVAANAQLWRISDDVWDRWERPESEKFPQGVKNQFAVIASWTPFVKPGNWPDADMLPLGTLGPVPGHGKPRKTQLTEDEQKTLMTLWAVSRSPLFIGANLTELDDWTAGLLTNKNVIAMDQHGHGKQFSREGDLVIWTSDASPSQHYVALFNLGDSPLTIDRPYDTMGMPRQQYRVRELWTDRVLDTSPGPTARAIRGTIAPHGVLLLELKR